MGLIQRHAELLEARGLDVELLTRLGIESSDRLGGDCIAIPYVENGRVVNHKYRTIGGEKRFSQDADARKTFWNVDALSDPSLAGEPVIIAEGEFDAVAALQAGYGRVVSVPDGAPAKAIGDTADSAKYSFLDNAPAAIKDVREFILCTDADPAGANLLSDLSLRLGRPRCKWVKYPQGCKDLNDALLRFGTRGVVETISRAQWVSLPGVYRMSDLPPVPLPVAYPTGLPGMDGHYRVRLGDFVVVTGIPSHGKTSWVNHLACNMAAQNDWNIVFASFEQNPQVDHRRNLRTFHSRKPWDFQTVDDHRHADDWIDRHFSFIVPNEDEDADLPWVLERCEAAVLRFGARMVVIDPWNELDHLRPGNVSLTEYTGAAIRQLRRFARKFNVHLIVVAHPTKQQKDNSGVLKMPCLYDISDSAHWYNKADVGIIVHRVGGGQTVVRVEKVRYHDQIGSPGEATCTFHRHTCRFEPADALAA